MMGAKLYGPRGMDLQVFRKNFDSTSGGTLFKSSKTLERKLAQSGFVVDGGNIRMHFTLPLVNGGNKEGVNDSIWPMGSCIYGNDVIIHVDKSNMELLFPQEIVEVLKFTFNYARED